MLAEIFKKKPRDYQIINLAHNRHRELRRSPADVRAKKKNSRSTSEETAVNSISICITQKNSRFVRTFVLQLNVLFI